MFWGILPISEIVIYKRFKHNDVEGMYKSIGGGCLFHSHLIVQY